nr:isoform 2 of zinc finger protein [Quercus suber]
MEFKYRAIDERAPNTQIPPPPSSSTTLPLPLSLSRPLQHLTTINGSVNDTLMTHNDIALARRRLELKAEVERQMMVEMEQSKMSLLRQHQYSSSPFGFSQDFYNNYMGMNPFLMMNHQQQQQHHRSSSAEVFGNVAAIQQLTARPVTQPLSEDIKEPVVEDTLDLGCKGAFAFIEESSSLLAIKAWGNKGMCLQKENEELPAKSSESSYFFSLTFLLDLVPRLEIHLPGFYYGLGSLRMFLQTKNVNFVEKRKAETPVVADDNDSNEAPSHSAVKKSRIEWSCDLCQVISTSQQALEGHLKGKKHKNKVASLNANKLPKDESTNDGEGKKHNNKVASLNAYKIPEDESANDDEGKKNKFWCQVCRVRTNSEAMLKSHCIGKKHQAKEALLNASKTIEESNGDEEKKHEDKLALVNGGKILEEKEEEEESNNEGKANLALLSPSKTSDESDDEIQKHHFWCQMCKVGTTSEALMTEHRHGYEHMNLLRKKRGAIIVISMMPEDVQEVEKTAAKN